VRARVSIALVACLVALFAVVVPAGAAPKVPRTFMGVIADGPLLDPAVDLGSEVALMRSSGVGSVRFSIYWDLLQPAPEVTDFGGTDRLMAEIARRRLKALPVVLRAPAWARLHPELPGSPPAPGARAAYARLLTALVGRYGPKGTFWAERPDLPRVPVRAWQVWNEPAGERDWSDQPGIPAYVKLLRPAYKAIKRADPKAQVVLAGLVGRSWEQLEQVYRHGGGRSFDAVAIHPFTGRVRNVLVILDYVRDVMRRHGARKKPLIVTELSWPSAKGRTSLTYGFEMTEQGQARRLTSAYTTLAAKRKRYRIPAVYWSSWLSYDRDPTYPFDYAGLRRLEGTTVVPKPAFGAWRAVAAKLERRR